MSNAEALIALPYNSSQARITFQSKFYDATDELEEVADLWFTPGESSRLGEGGIVTPWSSEQGCRIRVIEQFGSEIVTVGVLDCDEERRSLVHSVFTKHLDPPSRDQLLHGASEPCDLQAVFMAMLTALSGEGEDSQVEEVLQRGLDSDRAEVRAAAVVGLITKARSDFLPALRKRREAEDDTEVSELIETAIVVCSGEAELTRLDDDRVVARPVQKPESLA